MKSNPRPIADTPISFGLIVLLIAFLGVRTWLGCWIEASKQTKFRVLFNLHFSPASGVSKVVVGTTL